MSELQTRLRSNDHAESLQATEEAADALDAQDAAIADMQRAQDIRAATIRARDAEIARLTEQLRDTTWQDHADHWQKRALAAEAERDALRASLEDEREAWHWLSTAIIGEVGSASAAIGDEEGGAMACARNLHAGVAALRARLAGIHKALSGRTLHDYRCASEHGRYAARCDCGMQQAIDAARGGA